MAIYSLDKRGIAPARGSSVVKSAAYQSGESIFREATATTERYGRRERIRATGVELPGSAPDWMRDRARLWNAAEAAHPVGNAKIADRYIVAIPRELSDTEQRSLVEDFARTFTFKGKAVDWAIHDDEGNPHAHILVSSLSAGESGFQENKSPKTRNVFLLRNASGGEMWTDQSQWKAAKAEGWEKVFNYVNEGERVKLTKSEAKARGLANSDRVNAKPVAKSVMNDGSAESQLESDKVELIATRKLWADVANGYLEPYGVSIDHRSHAERGLEETPTVHEGARVRRIEAAAQAEAERTGKRYEPVTDERRHNVAARENNAIIAELRDAERELAEVERMEAMLHERAEQEKRAAAAEKAREQAERRAAHDARVAELGRRIEEKASRVRELDRQIEDLGRKIELVQGVLEKVEDAQRAEAATAGKLDGRIAELEEESQAVRNAALGVAAAEDRIRRAADGAGDRAHGERVERPAGRTAGLRGLVDRVGQGLRRAAVGTRGRIRELVELVVDAGERLRGAERDLEKVMRAFRLRIAELTTTRTYGKAERASVGVVRGSGGRARKAGVGYRKQPPAHEWERMLDEHQAQEDAAIMRLHAEATERERQATRERWAREAEEEAGRKATAAAEAKREAERAAAQTHVNEPEPTPEAMPAAEPVWVSSTVHSVEGSAGSRHYIAADVWDDGWVEGKVWKVTSDGDLGESDDVSGKLADGHTAAEIARDGAALVLATALGGSDEAWGTAAYALADTEPVAWDAASAEAMAKECARDRRQMPVTPIEPEQQDPPRRRGLRR